MSRMASWLPSRKRCHSPMPASNPEESWQLPTPHANPGWPHIPDITLPGAAGLAARRPGRCLSRPVHLAS